MHHFCRFSYYSQGNSQTFKAKGKYTLQTGTVFETEVKKDVLTGAVHATGNAESVTFIDMMVSFGLDINILPDFLVTALKWVFCCYCCWVINCLSSPAISVLVSSLSNVKFEGEKRKGSSFAKRLAPNLADPHCTEALTVNGPMTFLLPSRLSLAKG